MFLYSLLVWLQAYNAVSGIHKGEGRQWVRGNNKSRIKLAKLAEVLETFATWIQSSTAVIPTFDGEYITIKAGARLHRPARPFIMLWKIPSAWDEIRNRVRAFILTYLNNTTIRGGKTNSKRIVDLIAQQMERTQKNRITELQTSSNSEITQKIKGFDFPLVNSWRLFDSIKGKTSRTAVSGEAKEQKLKYLTQIDRILNDFNRK